MNTNIYQKKIPVGNYFKLRHIWRTISGDMDTPVFIGIIILACLFGVDIATTSIGLSLGATEANHVVVSFVGSYFTHFLLKWLVVVLMAMAVRWTDHIIPGVGQNVVAVLIGWYSFAVANNIHVLMGMGL
jgi:hypothetical protein